MYPIFWQKIICHYLTNLVLLKKNNCFVLGNLVLNPEKKQVSQIGLSLKRGFGGCDRLGGFSGFDGFSGFSGFDGFSGFGEFIC